MPLSTAVPNDARWRILYFLTHPQEWPQWPFLPLVRRKQGCEDEMGVVFDALHAVNIPGHSCTVYLCNIFFMPDTVEALFQLSRESFDTPEEVVNAGWCVD